MINGNVHNIDGMVTWCPLFAYNALRVALFKREAPSKVRLVKGMKTRGASSRPGERPSKRRWPNKEESLCDYRCTREIFGESNCVAKWCALFANNVSRVALFLREALSKMRLVEGMQI